MVASMVDRGFAFLNSINGSQIGLEFLEFLELLELLEPSQPTAKLGLNMSASIKKK